MTSQFNLNSSKKGKLVLGASKKGSDSNELEPEKGGSKGTGVVLGAKKTQSSSGGGSTANVGLKLIASLLLTGDIKTYASNKAPDEFQSKGEANLYEHIDLFITKYGVLPQSEELVKFIKSEGGDEPLPLPEGSDAYKFYYEELMDKKLDQKFKYHMEKALLLLKGGETPQKALTYMLDSCIKMTANYTTKGIIDMAKLMKDYAKNLKMNMLLNEDKGVRLGWEDLDAEMNGLTGGDILSIIGRPSMGKSWMAFWIAYSAWCQNKSPLVISMEMMDGVVMDRMMAMMAEVPYKKIKNYGVDDKAMGKIKGAVDTYLEKGTPINLVNGNLDVTVDSIVQMCLISQPDIVIVDAAYLLRHSNPYIDKNDWDRLRRNAEDLKRRVATELNLPLVLTYQFKRDVAKKKDNNEVGLEDIFGGDAIGQISSVVIGILEDESPDTVARRYMKMLKGRNGENSVVGFYTHWDFQNMNFSQWKEPNLEELQFSI